jgi:hypothetical protein
MKKNYALHGSANPTLDRKGAVWYLVDCCLNVEDYEHVGWGSVKLKNMEACLVDINEVAAKEFVKVDTKLLCEVYNTLKENSL